MICGDLGSLSPEHRAIVLGEPCWRMRWFASLLNWNGLQLQWVRDAALAPEGQIYLYYITNNDCQFHIQINKLPEYSRLYQVTVGPFRYGISQVKIGWHRFELLDDDAKLIAEADRLRPLLDRQQFRNPARRAAWKRAHPEFLVKSS